MSDQGSADQQRRQVYAIVRGMVQGVGFRYHTLAQAQHLGLGGSVCNRTDGGVEVVAEGPSDAVQQLLDWLEVGPAFAHVQHVYTQERTPSGLTRFEITH